MTELNPYLPPAATLEVLPELGEIQLASRLSRLTAASIDFLILPGAFLTVFIFFYSRIYSRLSQLDDIDIFVMTLLSLVMLTAIIINIVLLYRYGQTIGKYFLSIRIVRMDYSRVGLARIIFYRILSIWLLRMIPFIGNIIVIVNPLFIFQNSRRCLHDLIADTIVVKC